MQWYSADINIQVYVSNYYKDTGSDKLESSDFKFKVVPNRVAATDNLNASTTGTAASG